MTSALPSAFFVVLGLVNRWCDISRVAFASVRPEAGIRLGVIGLRLVTHSLVSPRRVRAGQLDGMHTCFRVACRQS